jgi:trehalose 2-sulfotransferase
MKVPFDLIGPDRDVRPPGDPVPPARPYLVACTPRSGSGLLCRGLAAAPGAGSPLEYFNPMHRGLLAERWGSGEVLAGYLRDLYAHRTTPAGVFGTKIHWDQLVALRAEALALPVAEPEYRLEAAFVDQLFPGAMFVRTIRLDVDRQAVSLWFALHTGTWSLAAGEAPAGRADVPYDLEGIEDCRRWIESGEVRWDRFLRHNGIEPVVVVYEELVSDYEATIERVLLEVAPDALDARVQSAPTTRPLSDDHSERVLERFLADRARLGPPKPAGHALNTVG